MAERPIQTHGGADASGEIFTGTAILLDYAAHECNLPDGEVASMVSAPRQAVKRPGARFHSASSSVLASPLGATLRQAATRARRTLSSPAGSRRTCVAPRAPQVPLTGTKTAGSVRTKVFCCSGVSLTMP